MDVQDNLNLRISHVLEDAFSLGGPNCHIGIENSSPKPICIVTTSNMIQRLM